MIALFPHADEDVARTRAELGLVIASMPPARLARLQRWLSESA